MISSSARTGIRIPAMRRVCSQCGSRELSTPHPRVPLWLAPLIALLSALARPAAARRHASCSCSALVNALVSNQQLLFQAVLAGLMLAFLWYLYMQLPHFLRRFLSRLFTVPIETTMATKLPNSRIQIRGSLPHRRPG